MDKDGMDDVDWKRMDIIPFLRHFVEFSVAGNGSGKGVCSTDMRAYERKRFQDSLGDVDLRSSSLNTELYALFITGSHQASVFWMV
jgi:hypothetical protein